MRISTRHFNERRSGDALLNKSKQSRAQALIVQVGLFFNSTRVATRVYARPLFGRRIFCCLFLLKNKIANNGGKHND